MKDKKKVWRLAVTILLAVVVIALVIPMSRSWIQQDAKKQESSKSGLETPQGNSPAASAASNKIVSFTDDQDKLIKIEDLAGKVVFINFWATWCPPCKAEMPSIQVLKDKFKDNEQVVFMMVEIEGESEKAHAFMQQGKMDLPIYYPASEIPSDWLGQSIPTTVILDKEGQVAAHHEGMADYSRKQIFDFITTLINK